jgi:acyl carrier protein
MTQSQDEAQVVWELLWKSLADGSYDIETLKAHADDDSHFIEDLHIDSLDLVEFYLRVEHHFHVDLPGDEYPNLTSVRAIASAVRERAGAQPR